jgi:hypothetical protein
MVRIHDHYAPADFMVLDIGEEDKDVPIILGRTFLNTTNAIIYVRSRQVYFHSLEKRYVAISIIIPLVNSQRRFAPRGDIEHLGVRGINS